MEDETQGPDLESLISEANPEISIDAVRKIMNQWAYDTGRSWAGVPMPISGHRLYLEPKYPFKHIENFRFNDELEEEQKPQQEIPDGPTPYVRNRWYSFYHNTYVSIFQVGDKVKALVEPRMIGKYTIGHTLNTLGISYQAWDVEAELKAMEKLHGLIKQHLWEAYFLTGTFIETSKRSGVTYMFRKLRPTIATAPVKNEMRVLAALCMHPIGFYQESWAGVMCPTDDVIAHLLMMRGDEHRYWREANQHPVYEPMAGLG